MACNPDLLMNFRVTNIRLNGAPNRVDRFEVLKFTLESYSRIHWDSVYLFVEIGDEFLTRKEELTECVNRLFSNSHNVFLNFFRMTTKPEWIDYFNKYSCSDDNKPIFFLTCEDHPFVDFDTDILNEGLKTMYEDTSQYKSIAMSHWPEALRFKDIATPLGREGNYLKFDYRSTETCWIYNLKYLKHFLIDREWPCDKLISYDRNGDVPMVCYVPLRELCRHFDGYAHVGMGIDDTSEFPQLQLDRSKNKSYYSLRELTRQTRMTIPYSRYATVTIPKDVENDIIRLYSPIIHYTGIVLVMDPTNHIGSPGISWLFDPNVFAMHINVWKKYMNSIPDNILTLFIRTDNSIPADTYKLDLDNNTLAVYGHHAYGKNNSALSLTIAALKIIPYHFTYDYIVRATTSSFWVYDRLHKMLMDLPKTGVFKGTRSFQHTTQTPNEPHVSGCGWIMSKDIGELMVENQERLTEQDWFDDLVISKFLTDKGIQLLDTPEFVNIERHMITYQELFDIISQRDDTVFYRVKLHLNRLVADEIALNILYDKHYS